MAFFFGQGATYDAIEGRFRRYRKMADDLRREAQARGVDVSSSAPRTPRGPRNRAPASSSKSNQPSTSKSRKVGLEKGGAPETPTKKGNGQGKGKGSNATNAIRLDSSSYEPEGKKDADELFVKMEGIKTESGVRRSPTVPVPSRAMPIPRVKPENLAAGSITPLKRSIEDDAGAESPTPRVKAERREIGNPFGGNPFGMGDLFLAKNPFVVDDYYEGAT